MKKILFITRGTGGVNYYRILTPFLHLKKNYNDFEYDYDNNIDYSVELNVNRLFNYDIIVYSKTILPQKDENLQLLLNLKEKGIKLFLDIDDYWVLDKSHTQHLHAKLTNDKDLTLTNITNATIVTTTNIFLLNKIKEHNTNVFILENGYDEMFHQFKSKWSAGNKIRISYMGGSSHKQDVDLLGGVTNLLLSDNVVKDKFVIKNCGFFTGGTGLKRTINPKFYEILDKLYLPKEEIHKELILNNFDITKVKSLPKPIVEMFKDKLITYDEVPLEPKQSPYYEYEKILTNNFKNLPQLYVKFLHDFKKEKHVNDDDFYYVRRWNKPVTEYLTFLDETDIVLAPLLDTEFNNSKSNLKMVEAITRKLPIVCSNVSPYNSYGVNEHNCLLIGNKKNSSKFWYKAIKKLILDRELRNKLGNNLFTDFSEKFSLNSINKKRNELFNKFI